MISDAEIVNLCAAVYRRPEGPVVDWDHYDDGIADDGICWGLYRAPGVDVIVMRGSITVRDWIRDFLFLGNPFAHRDLGAVHYGFLLGMPEMWSEAKRLVSGNVIVTGHSLGAARADVLAALMVRDGLVPAARVVFGEPQPGFASFCDLISPLAGRSYCNGDAAGHDLVTDVPLADPPSFPYVRPSRLRAVSCSPPPGRHGAFKYHGIDLYCQALKNAVPDGAA